MRDNRVCGASSGLASRLKALITNDSWIGLALQPINFEET